MESIGKQFMALTRPENNPESPQSRGEIQPPLELPVPEDARLISLPEPEDGYAATDLLEAINRRRTIRRYSEAPVSLAELSFFLWITQGVKRVTDRPATSRTVPSAGGRHAFETYLLVNRVESLAPGLYRYAALSHALFAVDLSAGVADRIVTGCLEQEQVRRSAVTFFWAAVRARMYYRYTERGYRYLFLDAGHLCQNLYLAAETARCGVCAIAAFDDVKINAALGLDGEENFLVYAASLGKRVV